MSRDPKDMFGICRSCKEWTSVAEPCCNAPVYFEGGWVDPEEYAEVFVSDEMIAAARDANLGTYACVNDRMRAIIQAALATASKPTESK